MILVVGSTGMLGGMITRRLLAEGRQVRILVRPGSQYQPLVDAGAQPVMGDMKDRQSLDAACQGVETVITTANSALRGGDDNPFTVEDQGNRNLIDAAQAAGVNHFIFVSVFAADPNSPIPFIAGKGKADQQLIQSGMTYTILAPVAFAEVWFGVAILGPIARGVPVMLYKGGDAKTNFISINDVAAYAVASVDNPAARNQVIQLGGPQPVSYPEVVQIFHRVMGKGFDVIYLEPGTPAPTIPESVQGLYMWGSMSGTFAQIEEQTRIFNLKQATPEEIIQNMLAAIPAA